jgi:predicted kinase
MNSKETAMPEIVLIRGIPGSGKTTLAKKMTSHAHVEADMYFEKDGVYKYNRAEVQSAHTWCLAQVNAALQAGRDVVVANTFVRKWEMNPYFQLGVPVRVIVATGSYRNVHGIPQEIIASIRQRWEE